MKVTFPFVAWFLLTSACFAQTKQAATKDGLYANFLTPPNTARPRVWWHWMNGNVTKDGIRKDLLWMHQSGIGGFQHFDAGLFTPQVVDKRLTFMTPDWKDAFQFATRLADSLQLEMAIAGSPGWSQSGGPWVPAQDGMKKLVWSQVRVTGGQPFRGNLPKPPATTGAFQNIPTAEESTAFTDKAAPTPEYYKDIAVIAYRLPAADSSLAALQPIVTSSGGNFTLAQLTDGDLATTVKLPADPVTGYAWIQLAFAQPQTIRAITLAGDGIRDPWGSEPPAYDRGLESSDDGINYRLITALPLGGVEQQTIAIPATTARYFRIMVKNPALSKYDVLLGEVGEMPKTPTGTGIAELVLHPVTRINHIEEKAGFASTFDVEQFPTPASSDVVAVGDVIDLTEKLKADGTLSWTPPAGAWKLIRFGYSLTGKKNHPASPEATGLEVDKMDGEAVKRYFDTYLNQYQAATGGLMGSRGLQYLITDSYEAGQETWTPNMAEAFQQRRGYALLPWMPVLTGQIINSTEASEQFLWDWRKTIGELITENHYDQLTEILAKRGMKRYSESHENGRLYLVDGMDVKRTAAVPMSAMWVPNVWGSNRIVGQADIRESASVAHIYGQNLVAAESMTAVGLRENAWSYSPANLKSTADLEMANGLNRFVIHTSVHQPVDNNVPGLGLYIFGQWFNRHETWAGQAKAWTDYLARSSYMLQQGNYVADVLYYYGEDNNITGLFAHKLPDVPAGYSYDFINPHALINRVSVKNGRLVTPSGTEPHRRTGGPMSYRVLVLDSNARKMSLPVLRTIAQLVKAGATISGVKPAFRASQNDDAPEFQRLVKEVWESGAANVHTGKTIGELLTSLHVQPDFDYPRSSQTAELAYVHRHLTDGDLYWVSNRKDSTETVDVSFRVSGKVPQIWHPETGAVEEASYRIARDRTTVTLHLTPNDAVFIVFQTPAKQLLVTLPKLVEQELMPVTGPWNVAFQPRRGAPAKATFIKLASYTDNQDKGINYFSGTATYTKTINVPASALTTGTPMWLDLGEVANLAEVSVNGKPVGVAWKKPFRVAVTKALQAGKNKLEIKVVNLWVNRLIGDQQPETKQKISFITMPFYKAGSSLQPAGLLGPVRLVSTNR